jgi:hypothetical protein
VEVGWQAKTGAGGGAGQFGIRVFAAWNIPRFEKIKLREWCLAA